MKSENNMKNLIMVGTIAGAISGVVRVIGDLLGSTIGLWEPFLLPSINYATIYISLSVLWGIIFGLIYSKFYDLIPDRGLTKAFYFGLLLWALTRVYGSSFLIAYAGWRTTLQANEIMLAGFFEMISIGLVLGYLYKK
ncbi:MAG: hypothetical protein NWF08_07580 [Candidatus Bathyarchaeota archaeon]|nr:hypothetical protein [Candidatus Bathyarchaeota archaeon]